MGAPKVELLLKGRKIQEIPFRTAVLRIGRMKENDVVVQNLGVSRFHATLAREGDRFVLQDAGSENGCYVNGERVSRAEVGPGDRIQVGKHELRIVLGAGPEPDAGEGPTAGAARPASDAWDGSATYVVGMETQARLLEGMGVPPDPAPAGADVSEGEAHLFGPEGAPTPREEFDVAEEDLREGEAGPDPAGAEREGETVAETDGAEELEEGTVLLEDAPEQAPGEEVRRYAGLILQRGGKLVRVLSWEAPRMTLGRATECEITLATAEVSRRHAMLVHEDGVYEVRDLESINGTYVNGEKVSRAVLQVGDVIRLDDFELTFVLEDRPIGDEIKTESPGPRAAGEAGAGGGEDVRMMTQITEVSDLAPFEAGAGSDDDSAPVLSFDEAGEPATAVLEGEDALLSEVAPADDHAAEGGAMDGEEEKPLPEAPSAAGVVAFEVRVRMDELPPRLREALAALGDEDLRLPVELRLRREDG